MALPNNPPISLSQVRAEFNAPANAPLSAFRRGGAYVPNTPVNAGVPTGLPIKLTDLLGASASTTPGLSAGASPASVSGTAQVGQPITTGSATVTVSGGSGAISYAWERVSGTGTINSPSSASTTFSAPAQGSAGSVSGVFRCRVTRGGASVYTNSVSATFTATAAPTLVVTVTPDFVSGSAQAGGTVTTPSVTASVTGGSGPISYSWTRSSGTGAATSPNGATTAFTRQSAGAGTYYDGWVCRATRGGLEAYSNLVTAEYIFTAPAMTATAAPTSVLGFSATNGGTATSGASAVTVNGGSGAISYLWERVSGDPLVSIRSPTSESTQFQAQVGTGAPERTAVFRCKVTRGGVTVYTNEVTATLQYLGGAF